jgi:hypothetical protein
MCGAEVALGRRYCSRECFHEWVAQSSLEGFWDRVQKGPTCWEWKGDRGHQRYGRISIRRRHEYAHRVAWELTNGPVPAGMCVMHRCDNTWCVRPDHLELGTPAENMGDMKAKGRARSGGRWNPGLPKLTMEAARTIRREAATTTQAQQARRFGVSPRAIQLVLEGRSWKEPT